MEARAEAAVADTDVVLVCFDTQSQQEGEFGRPGGLAERARGLPQTVTRAPRR
jgi:hypothetical protein